MRLITIVGLLLFLPLLLVKGMFFLTGGAVAAGVGGLLALAPVVGLVAAIWAFNHWRRGFHARMRRDGLW